MKVINFFGGPGIGKSTIAMDLCSSMKKFKMDSELVTEYAKDMVYENRSNILEDQIYIFAKQNRRVKRLEKHVDYAICDSPILLSTIYASYAYPNAEDSAILSSFILLAINTFNKYDNINFLLERNNTIEYETYGRFHNEKQAIEIDNKIKSILDMFKIKYHIIKAGEETHKKILTMVQSEV